MIGITVTTYNRPEVFEYSLAKITENTHQPYRLIVVDDGSTDKVKIQKACIKYGARYIRNVPRQGIPKSKERAFRALLKCDYQFWFDDDCFPRDPGWVDAFIDGMERVPHLLYLKKWHHIHAKRDMGGGVWQFNDGTACFMAFHRGLYDQITGFSQGKHKYGNWHHELTKRLTGGFYSLINASDMLFSFDMDGRPEGFDHFFSSSMTREERLTEMRKAK